MKITSQAVSDRQVKTKRHVQPTYDEGITVRDVREPLSGRCLPGLCLRFSFDNRTYTLELTAQEGRYLLDEIGPKLDRKFP